MRIAKPLLLVTTPIGVAGAIYEAYRQAGGLVIRLVALLSLIAVAFGSLIYTIRREAEEEKIRLAAKQPVTANAAE
jgi:uncharacterized protein (DUF58 family)